MRKSNSYVTTLDVFSATDMDVLAAVKATVKAINTNSKSKKRVVLRGRKPISKIYYSYDRGGNIVGGISNAAKLDVYIYDRR